MAKYLILIVFCSTTALASQWQAVYGFDYFSSSENWDSNGEKQNLNTGSSYDGFFQQLDLSYRHNRELRFHTGLDLDYARSQNTINERTNFQVSNLNFGADYRFFSKYGRWTIGSELGLAITPVNFDTDEVIATEGVNQLYTYGSYHKIFADRLALSLEAGYVYRDGGRSDLAKYLAEVQLISMPLIVALGIEGFSSITDDEFTQTPTGRTTTTTRVNGGSLHFYSVNPSRLDLKSWLSYSFSPKFATRLGFRKDLSGSNTSSGQSLFLNFYYSWGASSYGIEALGLAGFELDEDGEFKIIPDEFIEESYFSEADKEIKPERKKRRSKKRKKRRPKKSINDI